MRDERFEDALELRRHIHKESLTWRLCQSPEVGRFPFQKKKGGPESTRVTQEEPELAWSLSFTVFPKGYVTWRLIRFVPVASLVVSCTSARTGLKIRWSQNHWARQGSSQRKSHPLPRGGWSNPEATRGSRIAGFYQLSHLLWQSTVIEYDMPGVGSQTGWLTKTETPFSRSVVRPENLHF